MENMDFLPPIVPSLVFARETYTPYWLNCRIIKQGLLGSSSNHTLVSMVPVKHQTILQNPITVLSNLQTYNATINIS